MRTILFDRVSVMRLMNAMDFCAYPQTGRCPGLAVAASDTVMSWLNTIKNVGLAVLIYRFLPAMVTVW